MERNASLAYLGLKYNPFPPAATGVAFSEETWIPESWSQEINNILELFSTGEGAKATTIVGTYGSGKTFVLRWMMEHAFRARRIQPYFFDNPGLAFYDLANQLLRQVGRYELAKAVWELLSKPGSTSGLRVRLIELTFVDWLSLLDNPSKKDEAQRQLADALFEESITKDAEVAFRFARLIVDTRERPYYTFRDFVPRSPSALVPEREEAGYFTALIRILQRVFAADGIAFLIDEFEDIALGKRLALRQRSEYTATLRRLLDTADEEDFWVALSMTPEGLEQTRTLEPSLLERFSAEFRIKELSDKESVELIQHRLAQARTMDEPSGLWPFEEDAIVALQPTNRSSPRKLIRIFWQSLALAIQQNITPPIPIDVVVEAERRLSNDS